MVDESEGGHRRAIRSVRFRITALATLIVVLVLAATGVALVVLQRGLLLSAIDDSLRQRADDLEAVYGTGGLPETLGIGEDETFVQLTLEDGTAVASSGNVAGTSITVPSDVAAEQVTTAMVPAVDDDPFRLLTRSVEGPEGSAVLLVGGSLDDVRDAGAALARSLTIAVPVVAAALAALVWWLVGRALRPVESIRREVASISGSDLHRRVPEPATGDEIERLAVTMNAMLARVEDAALRQRRFTADASHELRSPLTRMRSELEVDVAHPSSADLAATHRSVLEEIDRLEHLMDDLLTLARSDAGRTSVEPREFDVAEVTAEEVARLRQSTSCDVAMELDPSWILGDPAGISRAVRNLLDNAARHARQRISVDVTSHDGSVVIAVADDGPGVPTGSEEAVFERFARLDEARSVRTGGTGLGLAIVRDIVKRHGGTVAVDTRHEPGARFVMTLPARSR